MTLEETSSKILCISRVISVYNFFTKNYLKYIYQKSSVKIKRGFFSASNFLVSMAIREPIHLVLLKQQNLLLIKLKSLLTIYLFFQSKWLCVLPFLSCFPTFRNNNHPFPPLAKINRSKSLTNLGLVGEKKINYNYFYEREPSGDFSPKLYIFVKFIKRTILHSRYFLNNNRSEISPILYWQRQLWITYPLRVWICFKSFGFWRASKKKKSHYPHSTDVFIYILCI